jgi:phospholipase/carboxylesterase
VRKPKGTPLRESGNLRTTNSARGRSAAIGVAIFAASRPRAGFHARIVSPFLTTTQQPLALAVHSPMPYTPHESAEAVVLAPHAPATGAVIWLHGLGADGFDFVPIVNEMRLPESCALRFVFPHAKMRPVTINNGFVMRAWYDITGFGPERTEDAAGIRESAETVRQYIAREVVGGVPEHRILIAGFSQGGAIALHTALRHPQPLAGVLALSTYLPLPDTLAHQASAANRDTPIMMCHGQRDPIVPHGLGEASRDFLQSMGYTVRWRSYPMEHQVCMEEVVDIADWLKSRLAVDG